MRLPKNLQVLPGVKQDHAGRLYRMARYPSGKLVEVPYADTNAEPARMIPPPPEPVKVRRVLKLQKNLVKRELHVLIRHEGDKAASEVTYPNHMLVPVLSELLPLMRSPDLGATWKRVEKNKVDFYHFWHEDVKEVVA